MEKQANFKLTKRIKSLTPSITSDFNISDSYDAFKELRWGWRDGLPQCPKCKYEKFYEWTQDSKRNVFKCAKCGHHYTAKSKSVLHRSKLKHKAIIYTLSDRLYEPSTSVDLARKIDVTQKTAWLLIQKFKFFSGNIAHVTKERRWPFLTGKESEEDTRLLKKVSKAIPVTLPEQVRGDVGQEMILGMLMGDFTEDMLISQVRKYIGKHYQNVETKWGSLSINQPYYKGSDSGSWDDHLASDIATPEELLLMKEHFESGGQSQMSVTDYGNREKDVRVITIESGVTFRENTYSMGEILILPKSDANKLLSRGVATIIPDSLNTVGQIMSKLEDPERDRESLAWKNRPVAKFYPDTR